MATIGLDKLYYAPITENANGEETYGTPVQLAKALGCTVIGTTHKEEKLSLLKEAGCDEAILDDGSMKSKISGVNKALELVGIKTLRDTLFSIEKGGIVCNTGVLGKVYEWNGFDPIKDIPNGVYLTGFFSNYPTQKMVQDIFTFMDEKHLEPLIGATFDFAHIKDACVALDKGTINGKIVVSARIDHEENDQRNNKGDPGQEIDDHFLGKIVQIAFRFHQVEDHIRFLTVIL